MKENDSTGVFVGVQMLQSGNAMAEVVVRAGIPPAIVHNDTIAFNAGAYALHPNSTVEDLLKKLPGVNVDKDGVVTMQGKKVDKIYIDGKEFFLGDLKAATRNLPADIVAQIETYDSQTDKDKLTGIKSNTGTKTLNVKLKSNRKAGYFGRVYAGAGNDNTYAAGATVNSMAPTRWFYFSANTNNVNNQFPPNDFGSPGATPGFQSFGNLNLNYRQEWNKKFTTAINGSFNSNKTSMEQTSDKQTFLSDSSLVENRFSQSKNNNHNWRVDGVVDYKMDSSNTLLYRLGWSPGKMTNNSMDTVSVLTSKPSGNYLSNRGETDNSSNAKSNNLSNSLEFRHSFLRKGRTFYIGLTQSSNDQQQPASLYTFVNNFDSAGNIVMHNLQDQRSTQTSSGNNYGAAVTYTEPLSAHHILDFNYNITNSVSRTDKTSFAYDSTSGKYDILDTTTTNHFRTINAIQKLGAGYNVTFTKYSYQVGLAAQFSNLDNNNYTLKSQINQRSTNWYPRASLIYNLSKGKSLNFNYSGYNTTPTIDQLQPLPDLTNPFLVRLGNPNLKQQFDHNIRASYTGFNSVNFQNLQIAVDGGFTEHKITGATTILSGGIQQLQYVNTDGNFRVGSDIVYGFPLGSEDRGNAGKDNRSGNANISGHTSYSRDISFLNGVQNVTDNINAGGRFDINYHLKEKLFLDVNANVEYTTANYSVNSSQNTHILNQNYDVKIFYELPLSFHVSSNYGLQVTGSQGSLPARGVSFWNASLYKTFFRNQSTQIWFSVFDLLNSVSSYMQMVGPNYVMTSKSNLRGRTFFFGVVYNFRKFPTTKPVRTPGA